jgi:DnaJ domain
MAQPDFYAIFGLSPSASQEEIRATHRELVKRYHPDIYSTSGDKARATEKLRQINEAYAVLGNAERRKAYDASRAEPPRRPPPAAQTRSSPAPRSSNTARRQTARRPLHARRKFRWNPNIFTPSRIAATLTGVTLSLATLYILNRPSEITPVWLLLQKTEVETAAGGPAATNRGWERLGTFGVRAECARVLKTHVKADQEQGSQAVLDESNATMAITILLRETDPALSANPLLAGQKTLTKRVRHYECRTVQVRQPETWLRQKLRQTGWFE